MVQFFESLMLICFGISWPISVYKSLKSRSTKGKSVIFTVAILLGYISGIFSKIIGGNINYVLYLYIFNFIVISIDFVLYFINRHHEKTESTVKA
ncbi:MAG: hypothetical protein IJ489_08385 [Clostridia bacterium]|nr:hypothetical protein [Clostridia bacterium]